MTRSRARTRTRRALWVVAAIALGILGPARPFVLTAMRDDAGPVTRAGSTVRLGSVGTWTVQVDLTDEVSEPFGVPDIPPPSSSKRHALLIGIDHARGGHPLPGSVTDAKNMRDALLMYGFKRDNITMLTEGAATRDAIRSALTELAQRTPANGIAVFAVSTHTRRSGGGNELLTADGLRISGAELAERLGAVKSRMWVALPTCYAAGYALPGIVGRNRIATFASSADRPSYQLGSAGSFLILNMVRRAMLEHRAPGSVEDAFRWARQELERTSPDNVPSMSDGIPGELILGRAPQIDPAPEPDGSRTSAQGVRTHTEATSHPEWLHSDPGADPSGPSDPSGGDQEDPTPPSSGSSNGGVGVCGSFQAHCNH